MVEDNLKFFEVCSLCLFYPSNFIRSRDIFIRINMLKLDYYTNLMDKYN